MRVHQLHGEYGRPPGIDLAPLGFEYSALFQVDTCNFIWWRLYQDYVRDQSLFMTGGPPRKMILYRNTFQGPLVVRTKHFAAHSTSHDNFSMPTLGEFFGKKYFDAHSGLYNSFFDAHSLHIKIFSDPPLFPPGPPGHK